jgi:predicted ArsR family transcriptional regulator
MSDERSRSEKGTYTEEVSPDDALAVFTDHEPRTASEVAEELGIVRRTAHNKLTALEERGDLKRKKVGGRAVVWWRPNPPEG